MKIFIGIKYYKDKRNSALIEAIKDIVKSLNYEPYSFTEEGYIENEREMIQKALRKIEECDILILEASEPSFGVGIEAGYGFSKNKKIITIFNEAKPCSRTLKGISHYCLSYKNIPELKRKLQEVLNRI